VHGGVGAQDGGQDHRVGVVGFLAAGRIPLAVAGDGHRVDRVDLAAGGAKRGDQEAAGRLDRDWDRVSGGVARLGQHRHQLAEALDGLLDPAPGHARAILIGDRDVMMSLGPVNAARDLQGARSPG
jgi:hypothetical protein